MMENNKQNSLPPEVPLQDDGAWNVKEIIFKFLRYWPWFVIACFISFLVAFLYLRYTVPTYKITSEVLIKDDQTGTNSTEDLLNQLDVLNTKNNVDNEKEVLQTRYLMGKVVDELHLNISYFAEGNIKSTELYQNCPFKINIIYLKDSIAPQRFNFEFQNGTRTFTIERDDAKTTHQLNDTIKTPKIIFTVQQVSPFPKWENLNYSVVISTPENATYKYYHNLTTDITSKQASVILLTLEETVPKKGEDILNELYDVYTRMNEDDKNKIADSTISFIDGRLAIVSNELSGVEKNIEEFKKKNDLSVNLQDQANLVLSNAADVQKQLIQQEVQISVVESIEDHLKSNGSRVVPNASVIQDPTYISTVEKYNDLVLERDRQLETSKPDNPVVKNLNSQIENVKKDLLISLANIKRAMTISKNELAQKNDELLSDIKSSPSKERVFLDISRQQEVKQQLYLYLLQKREETAISKSGTLSNSRLIEPPKSDQKPFEPKKTSIYLIALFSGIVVPSLILYLKESLNSKVSEKKDILAVTQVPIVGELGHNDSEGVVIATQDSRTALSEQFRAIRTNLQFILKGREHQAILITSSMGGEGKSFLSINLASSLAISGKKVALLELDLRKPKISKQLGLSQRDGFSNYMVSDLQKENLPKTTAIHPNLFVISAGTLPPNPAELLLQTKVQDFFAFLKSEFDYIIVDTPPVGLVTDAIIIGQHADACLYIIRQRYTLKQQVSIVNDLANNSKIPNVSIIVNDVQHKRRYGYGYGYGYSYGYGYGYGSNGYYSDSHSKGKKWKLLKKSR